MQAAQDGVATEVIEELASFIHDIRREQASDILHHLEHDRIDSYKEVLRVFCDGNYRQLTNLMQQEAKAIAIRFVNKTAEIASGKERLSDWMEACKEAHSQTEEKQLSLGLHKTGNEDLSSPLRKFIAERYANGHNGILPKEECDSIALNVLKKIEEPISEQMAFNIAMSFMKAISSELSSPIPTNEQKAIAKRTANGIRRLLTTANKIHITGKRIET